MPHIIKRTPFLPQIPINMPASVRRVLTAIAQKLEELAVDPSPPDQPAGVTATRNNLGVLLAWLETRKAHSYRIYRNTSGTFAATLTSSGASVIAELAGARNRSYFDSIDQTVANQTRYYWLSAVSEIGQESVPSLMVSAAGFGATSTGTALGRNALAAGVDSISIGDDSRANADESITIGQGSNGNGITIGVDNLTTLATNTVVVGNDWTCRGNQNLIIGSRTTASTPADSDTDMVLIGFNANKGANAGVVGNIIIGSQAVCRTGGGIAIGYTANIGLLGGDICIGNAAITSAGAAIAIGPSANASNDQTIVFGPSATSTATRQITFGSGSDATNNSAYSSMRQFVGINAQQHIPIRVLTELTTIAAAATTDTTITIPANAVVYGVSVRVTTVIPTAATFDYGVAAATTRYGTAISTAANTTYAGTDDGVRAYTAATAIRVTPNLVPANNSGRVRVTIHFYEIVPPTS